MSRKDYHSAKCAACGDSGTAYWCDDVYGSCMDCCCIQCGEFYKNCECVPPPPAKCAPCDGTGRVAGAICTVCCCDDCGKSIVGDVRWPEFDTTASICGLCECETS